jgi:hypothetical protein
MQEQRVGTASRRRIGCFSPQPNFIVGVVLTTGDGDGRDGLRALKKAGRVAIVQDPADADCTLYADERLERRPS